MTERIKDIGCVVMASGLSARYGRDKLLERLDGREIIRHTVGSLKAAGLMPLVVTRSDAIRALMEREGIQCVRPEGPLKSDTMRAGLESLSDDFRRSPSVSAGPRDPASRRSANRTYSENAAGFLFMPADQPLVRPASLKKLAERFLSRPARAVMLGFGDVAGSPVIFPAACRSALLAYRGDRGGKDVLRKHNIPCGIAQAEYEWELWDVDTPEGMERVREVYNRFIGR